MFTDQLLCSRVHRGVVEQSGRARNVVSSDRRCGLGFEEDVLIASPCCAESRMELCRHRQHPANAQLIGQQTVGALNPRAFGAVHPRRERYDLLRRMYAGVGTPRRRYLDRLGGDPRERFFERLLNRALPYLTLPPMKGMPVVFDA